MYEWAHTDFLYFHDRGHKAGHIGPRPEDAHVRNSVRPHVVRSHPEWIAIGIADSFQVFTAPVSFTHVYFLSRFVRFGNIELAHEETPDYRSSTDKFRQLLFTATGCVHFKNSH